MYFCLCFWFLKIACRTYKTSKGWNFPQRNLVMMKMLWEFFEVRPVIFTRFLPKLSLNAFSVSVLRLWIIFFQRLQCLHRKIRSCDLLIRDIITLKRSNDALWNISVFDSHCFSLCFASSSSRKSSSQWEELKHSPCRCTRGVCGWFQSRGASLGQWKQARLHPVPGGNTVRPGTVGRDCAGWAHRKERWLRGWSSLFPVWTPEGNIHKAIQTDQESGDRGRGQRYPDSSRFQSHVPNVHISCQCSVLQCCTPPFRNPTEKPPCC